MACLLEDIDVASMLEQNCFRFFYSPPNFKMAGNSFKQRYFGSLSTWHPYLPPQVWCKKEKCLRDNLRWNFLDSDLFVELQETQKARRKISILKRTTSFGHRFCIILKILSSVACFGLWCNFRRAWYGKLLFSRIPLGIPSENFVHHSLSREMLLAFEPVALTFHNVCRPFQMSRNSSMFVMT